MIIKEFENFSPEMRSYITDAQNLKNPTNRLRDFSRFISILRGLVRTSDPAEVLDHERWETAGIIGQAVIKYWETSFNEKFPDRTKDKFPSDGGSAQLSLYQIYRRIVKDGGQEMIKDILSEGYANLAVVHANNSRNLDILTRIRDAYDPAVLEKSGRVYAGVVSEYKRPSPPQAICT